MSSVGISSFTFLPITDWKHVVQSIGVILLTEVGSRVQRRSFGSMISGLIDAPQNQETLVDLYMSIATALQPRVEDGIELGEPRFLLNKIDVAPSAAGKVDINVTGTYFPDGHKGDFTLSYEDRSTRLPIGAFV
jgi:uncharacterized protein